MKRGFLVAASMLVASIFMSLPLTQASAAAPTPRVGGVLNVASQAIPPHLDPAKGGGAITVQLRYLAFNTLVTYSTNGTKIVPDLATHWQVLDHGREYVFYLRHGVTFSNGDPLTAQDVVFTFTRLNEASTACPAQSDYSDLVGAEALFQGKRTNLASGISAVGKYEVVMHLVNPESYWLNIVAWTFASIEDPRTAATLDTHPVGTGPFVFVTSTHQSDYVYKRNPHYWDKPYPYLSEISIHIGASPQLQVQRFERGQYNALLYLLTGGIDPADYLSIMHSRWRADYMRAPVVGIDYLGFNVTQAPYNNLDLRRAMEYAVNKQLVFNLAFNRRGQIANSILPPGMPGYSPSLNPYPGGSQATRLATAKRLLAKSGYHGQTLTLTYWTGPGQDQFAQAVAEGLQQAGMHISLRPVSFPTFLQLGAKPGGLGLYLSAWIMDYPSPQDFLYNLFSTAQRGGNNYDFYSNKAVDALLAKADGAASTAAGMPDYLKAQALILKQAAVVPLVFPIQDMLLAPNVYPKSTAIWMNPVSFSQLQRVWIR